MFIPRLATAFANTTDVLENVTNGLDATLLAAGWERSVKGDSLVNTSGSTDRVYWSGGENGRESLYLRITQSGQNIDIRAYTFWDPVGHTGANVIGNATGNTRVTGQASAMVVWLFVSKDFVALIPRTAAGVYQGKLFGGILERHVPKQRSGQTVVANGGGGAASGQTIVKVADVTNFEVGQTIWLVNQKAGANMAHVERATIQSINTLTNNIQVLVNLTNAYDDGALVAFDPQPLLLWASTTGASEAFVASTNRYMFNDSDGLVAAPGAVFLAQTHIEDQGLTTFNPDDFGEYDVEDFLVYMNAGGKLWRRGYVSRFTRVETGAFSDEDNGVDGPDTFLLTQELDTTWLATKLVA